MSNWQAAFTVAFIWCYFWGAAITLCFAFLAAIHEKREHMLATPVYLVWIAAMSTFWPLSVPWFIITTVTGQIDEAKAKRKGTKP